MGGGYGPLKKRKIAAKPVKKSSRALEKETNGIRPTIVGTIGQEKKVSRLEGHITIRRGLTNQTGFWRGRGKKGQSKQRQLRSRMKALRRNQHKLH